MPTYYYRHHQQQPSSPSTCSYQATVLPSFSCGTSTGCSNVPRYQSRRLSCLKRDPRSTGLVSESLPCFNCPLVDCPLSLRSSALPFLISRLTVIHLSIHSLPLHIFCLHSLLFGFSRYAFSQPCPSVSLAKRTFSYPAHFPPPATTNLFFCFPFIRRWLASADIIRLLFIDLAEQSIIQSTPLR